MDVPRPPRPPTTDIQLAKGAGATVVTSVEDGDLYDVFLRLTHVPDDDWRRLFRSKAQFTGPGGQVHVQVLETEDGKPVLHFRCPRAHVRNIVEAVREDWIPRTNERRKEQAGHHDTEDADATTREADHTQVARELQDEIDRP